jgi:TatD DNase family protein
MIDSHCHLNVDAFADDVDEVVDRAGAAGIHGILVPGIGLEESRRAVELARRFPGVRAAVGIHPHEALQWGEVAEERLREWAELPEVVAIGEIGLDFYRDWSPEDAQRRAYAAQLRLARELDLPVVVHDRDAHADVLRGIRETEGVRGVLHCFSGGPAEAEEALARGFHVSFTGSITYAKGRLADVLRVVPLERLLLETDAPWMTPTPHRGKRNEPAYVARVAETLAEKLGRDLHDVLRETSAGAGRLFGFPPEPPVAAGHSA